MIPTGATDIQHQPSRKYGGRRTGDETKPVSLRATGLMPGDAVLGAVAEKLGVTQAIAFQWRKLFFQRETITKREWFDSQHAAPQSREDGHRYHLSGWKALRKYVAYFLKNKCFPASRMSNSRNSDALERLLVV